MVGGLGLIGSRYEVVGQAIGGLVLEFTIHVVVLKDLKLIDIGIEGPALLDEFPQVFRSKYCHSEVL